MDPSELKDYEVTWQAELTARSDTLLTSTFTLPDEAIAAGVEIDSQEKTEYGGVVFFKVAAEEQADARWEEYGQTYAVRHTITTVGGRTYERSINLTIKQL